MWTDERARDLLRALFDDAVASARPDQVLAAHLPDKPTGRCIVVGAGKASAAMAATLEAAWPDVNLSGVVVTRYEHAVPCGRIRIIEAAHPVPDDNSMFAARAIMGAVEGLAPDDLVIALMSGGGSSLMVAPIDGLTLKGKQAINKSLLHSGATIHEMNVVRQAFSEIKGGRLLRLAQPAKVVTLVISDVPGDDPAIIASGPTVPTKNVAARAADILRHYGIFVPEMAKMGKDADTVEPHQTQMIATPHMALAAALTCADRAHVNTVVLGDAIEGEACEVGKAMAGMAMSAQKYGDPVAAPGVLLSGGETTVSIGPEGAGRGGRNTEFLLSLALALDGKAGIYAIACDTDGIDGTEDAAGAVISPDTLARGRAAGLDARDFLRRHDSYSYFKALGDLVVTGPTLTNVNDFRAILVV